MNPYADSSFLVSCYTRDANTASANDYLARTRTPLVFTALHALEYGTRSNWECSADYSHQQMLPQR